MKINTLDIVIATYNGESYILEQLDSILASDDFQSIVDKIIISDDNSTDRTREILTDYTNRYSFIDLHINKGKKGVIGNFSNALNLSTADYVVLCDQDDYWKKDKLTILINGLKDIERNVNGKTPCLFFTDLEVVDVSLQIIDKSFFHMIKNNPDTFFKTHSVLLMNIVPGCSMIINKKLKEIALPIKDGIYLHDWWFLLIAHFVGEVGFSRNSTFKYRQHDRNTLGANKRSFFVKFRDSVKDIFKRDETFNLCEDLYERLSSHDLLDESSVLFKFLQQRERSKLSRLRFMFKNRIYFKSPLRNFRLVINVLFKKSQ